jgi:hypothetical protein
VRHCIRDIISFFLCCVATLPPAWLDAEGEEYYLYQTPSILDYSQEDSVAQLAEIRFMASHQDEGGGATMKWPR